MTLCNKQFASNFKPLTIRKLYFDIKESRLIFIDNFDLLLAMPEATVLSKKLSDGPLGLGDPDDKTLRKVEIEVLIPKLIRDKAKEEKCVDIVADFNKCCKASSLLMVIKCRKENSALKSCLSSWYNNEDFKKECTEEYLNQRSEYRRTGIKKPIKRA